MASISFVLLSLALVAISVASPVPTEESALDTSTVTVDDVPLVEIIKVIEVVPVVPLFVPTTPEPTPSEAATQEAEHKVAKRSVLRGDNPSNDLLADLEGLNYENGLSSLVGRKIKFLPTWLG